MKKLLTLFIMLVYGFASTGATLHLHYCCGKLDKVSFSTEHNPKCPKKEGVYKNCCDSKQVDIKIKADQQPVVKWVTLQQDSGSTLPLASFLFEGPIKKIVASVHTTGPPVRPSSVPLFIRHCVFRI
jgi:hypothetical protein